MHFDACEWEWTALSTQIFEERVSEVLVHGHQTPFLGLKVRLNEHHGGIMWWKEAAHMVIRRERGRGEAEVEVERERELCRS